MMKSATRSLVLITLCTVFSGAHAADWHFQDAEILGLSAFHDGESSVYTLELISSVPVDECNASYVEESVRTVSFRSEQETPPAIFQNMYSTAVAAHAQEKPVDIMVDVSICHEVHGMEWRGTRISSE